MTSMHSSTSSSERQRVYQRATFRLIAVLTLMAIATEGVVLLGFSRLSRLQKTFDAEYRASIAQGSRPGVPPRILVVGNSLLEAAVDYPRARAELARDADL